MSRIANSQKTRKTWGKKRYFEGEERKEKVAYKTENLEEKQS